MTRLWLAGLSSGPPGILPLASVTTSLLTITASLRDAVGGLAFGPPVTHVYNPLAYAWEANRRYLERFGEGPGRVLLVGLNPGPFGMAQTGIPFGDVVLVREWLGINAPVGQPPVTHPKRSVLGFECARREVSGSRFWGWARDRFGTADRFFSRFFVLNYCPLAFMEASGRNRTPDKLPAAERGPLFAACDLALRAMIEELRPRLVVGVGRFAEGRARAALDGLEIPVGTILHPSPASPAANRDWAGTVERQLEALGVSLGPIRPRA